MVWGAGGRRRGEGGRNWRNVSPVALRRKAAGLLSTYMVGGRGSNTDTQPSNHLYQGRILTFDRGVLKVGSDVAIMIGR